MFLNPQLSVSLPAFVEQVSCMANRTQGALRIHLYTNKRSLQSVKPAKMKCETLMADKNPKSTRAAASLQL